MGKINPIKGLMGAGAGFLTGGPVGAGMGFLGSSGVMGGGGKKKGVQGLSGLPPDLLQRLLGLADQGSKQILDTKGTVTRFRDDSMEYADRSSETTGAQLAQSTGNPYMRAAAKLDARNTATDTGNRFQQFAYSPEGQGSAYERALSLYNPVINAHLGLEGLSLQKRQIGAQNRQPTIWESLLNTGGSNLGSIFELLKNKKKQGTPYLGWNTQGANA